MSTSEPQPNTNTEPAQPTIPVDEIIAIINPVPPGGINEKTYTGSCHCGLVTYSASLPSDPTSFSFSLSRCNCSICLKKGYLAIYVRDTSTFKVLTPGEDSDSAQDVLGDYTFGGKAMHHRFCKNCGTNLFVKGVIPELATEWTMVNAYTVDGVDFSKMKPGRYWDGKGENWLKPSKEPVAPGVW